MMIELRQNELVRVGEAVSQQCIIIVVTTPSNSVRVRGGTEVLSDIEVMKEKFSRLGPSSASIQTTAVRTTSKMLFDRSHHASLPNYYKSKNTLTSLWRSFTFQSVRVFPCANFGRLLLQNGDERK